MKMYIYTNQIAHGIFVIVDNLVKAIRRKGVDCTHIKTLNGISKECIIIPFGVKEAIEVYSKGYRPFAAFLCDAISLGYQNKIKFYLSNGHIFNYDFWYSIYGYLRYSHSEKIVTGKYEYVILVAEVDIEYLQNKYPFAKCKYICTPNGAPEVKNIKKHVPSDQIRLGILSPWASKQIYEESNWFIRNYFRRYHKNHPNTILKLAGRGRMIHRYEGMEGVDVMGEVPNLTDYFANIDVFISSNPKGCGILNRVLDAFMYQVPVLGHVASFSGFPNSDELCYKFSDYRSFESMLESISNNREEALRRTGNAIKYVQEKHNWEKNYKILVDKLLSCI